MGVRNGSDGRRGLWRSRWAAIGAAVAVTLGGGGFFVAQAASSVPSSVVTIDPVRILDTRTNVGLSGPFVSLTPRKLQVTGAAVPAGATGVLLNATVVAPAAAGFLSVRPGDATGAPSTSSLNFEAGDIVPNSVQVGLPTSGANAGQIDITYDAFGIAGPTTEVLIDVVGYMMAGGAGTGPAGPPGPKGDTGVTGAQGQRGVSAWDTIPSGVTVTGYENWDLQSTGTAGDFAFSVRLPAKAPVALTSGVVNFSASSGASPLIGDGDASCTGSTSAPTAPPGKVCLYRLTSNNAGLLSGLANTVLGDHGFSVVWQGVAAGVNLDVFVKLSWAYTAP